MDARETEDRLLARCALAARSSLARPRNDVEANVFRVAGMVVRASFPEESARLVHHSERYFAHHPDERVSAEEVVRKGWVFSLPRLKTMLARRLVANLAEA
jgi:hypothetical protein